MEELAEHKTGDEKHYNFVPFCGKTLRFGVQAAHDAHLAFTTGDDTSEPMVEVFLGGWEGEYSAVRWNQGDDLTKVGTEGLLSEDEMREFWISLDHQEVRVGKGGEHEPFMTANIPEDIKCTHFAYTTGWGAAGTFKFFKEREISTDDKLEYCCWEPMYGNTVTFSVCCDHDAHVAFSMEPEAGEPLYEFFIGGWDNQNSAIRKNKDVTVLKVDTPDECSGEKTYTIDLKGGHLKVTRAGEDEPFMDWEDPEPFQPKYFSFCTGWGASGQWKLEV